VFKFNDDGGVLWHCRQSRGEPRSIGTERCVLYTVGTFFVHEMEARKKTAELTRHGQDNRDTNT